MESDTEDLRQDIAELKEMVGEMDDTLRSIRRNQRWHAFVTIAWWLTIIGVTGAAYYYMQPYIQRVVTTYEQVQQGADTAQNWQSEAQEFLSEYFKNRTPTQ
jgi:hypothetical protein